MLILNWFCFLLRSSVNGLKSASLSASPLIFVSNFGNLLCHISFLVGDRDLKFRFWFKFHFALKIINSIEMRSASFFGLFSVPLKINALNRQKTFNIDKKRIPATIYIHVIFSRKSLVFIVTLTITSSETLINSENLANLHYNKVI